MNMGLYQNFYFKKVILIAKLLNIAKKLNKKAIQITKNFDYYLML